jgi:hypothetical protein
MTQSVNYTNYDFDDMVIKLQNRLASKDAWKDVYRSSTGEMLIEFLAYILNYGLFYTERRAQESFLSTAQLRSSLVNMVSLINYSPKRKTSSTGNLTFTLDAPSSKIIYIPKYTKCKTADGLSFVTFETGTIEKNQTSINVKAIQGSKETKEITSDGSLNQEYIINDTCVENSSSNTDPTFNITIDGEEWDQVSTFIKNGNDDKVYRIINELDGTVSVKFGDNINGLAPDSGSTILINYIKTNGADGNVSNADKITTIEDTIYDEDSGVITNITVTNEASFLGGDDEEDIEEIRSEAPRVFKTGDRAVNKEDFMAILTNYAGVADANVWGENEEAEKDGVPAVASMLNKVKIVVLLQDWELADSTFQETLGDYLYNKSMMTVKYEFVEPEILDVIPTLTVKVSSGNSLADTQSEIDATLETNFKLGSAVNLGSLIKYSKIISDIQVLDSVSYVNMDLEIKQALSTTYDSGHTLGAKLKATAIEPGTARLFFETSYVVSDIDQGDGTGTFTSSGAYTITGTINYNTGVVLIDSTSTPTVSFIRYQQAEKGNISPGFNQIGKLNENGGDFVSITMDSE